MWELKVVQYFWYNITASANSKLKVTVYVSVVQTVIWSDSECNVTSAKVVIVYQFVHLAAWWPWGKNCSPVCVYETGSYGTDFKKAAG